MRDFKNLDVWQRAHQLTLSIYQDSLQFPRSEIYGLRAQLRKAAVSIEANIAEGSGRPSRSDYSRFLDIALASSNELECEILVASDLGYLPAGALARLMAETSGVRRMLVGLRNAIESTPGIRTSQ